MDDDGMGSVLNSLKSLTKRFEIFQRLRTDLVARRAVQDQFDKAVLELVRHRLSGLACRGVHAVLTVRYMSSISFFMRAEIRSRFSLPLAVNSPLSIEKASARMWKALTCL